MSDHTRYHASGKSNTILLVEDNPGDIRLVQEAFEMIDSETTLRHATTGEDALEFLKRVGADESRSLPDLALVDLNLPGMDGCDLLEAVRDDPRLRLLPMIMLTSSADGEDIERCYDAEANAYLTKPTDPAGLASLLEAIEQFWFERVRLPPIPR